MRCQNCGSENGDNLYICQNCGSPLYEEETATVTGETQKFAPAAADPAAQENKNNRQPWTIVIILSVVLCLVIAGIAVAVMQNKRNTEDFTAPTLTQEETSARTTEDETTETTTEQTTAATTKPTTTTTTTTKPATNPNFTVSISSNDGGETEGTGTYELGENITVFARPNDGYAFEGWYENGVKVATETRYTFTVTKDVSLRAVFTLVTPAPADSEGIENMDGGND